MCVCVCYRLYQGRKNISVIVGRKRVGMDCHIGFLYSLSLSTLTGSWLWPNTYRSTRHISIWPPACNPYFIFIDNLGTSNVRLARGPIFNGITNVNFVDGSWIGIMSITWSRYWSINSWCRCLICIGWRWLRRWIRHWAVTTTAIRCIRWIGYIDRWWRIVFIIVIGSIMASACTHYHNKTENEKKKCFSLEIMPFLPLLLLIILYIYILPGAHSPIGFAVGSEPADHFAYNYCINISIHVIV